MIHFFRDILDGPIYIVLVVISIILIMGILGFIMERYQKKKEGQLAVKVVNASNLRKGDKLIINSNQSSQEQASSKKLKNSKDLEKTEVLDLASISGKASSKDLEKTEVLNVVSIPEKPPSKDLEKTEVLNVVSIPEKAPSKDLEKTEVLNVVSIPEKAPSKDLEKTEMLNVVSIPEKALSKDLEKTEVLNVVSIPEKPPSKDLEKTEVLELNFNKIMNEPTKIFQSENESRSVKPAVLSINSEDIHVKGDSNMDDTTSLPQKVKKTTVIDFGSTSNVKAHRE